MSWLLTEFLHEPFQAAFFVADVQIILVCRFYRRSQKIFISVIGRYLLVGVFDLVNLGDTGNKRL